MLGDRETSSKVYFFTYADQLFKGILSMELPSTLIFFKTGSLIGLGLAK